MKNKNSIFLIVGIVALLGIGAYFVFKPKAVTETPEAKAAREKAEKEKADADALAAERAKETPAERATRIAQEAAAKAVADAEAARVRAAANAEAARVKAAADAAAAAAAAEALRIKNEGLRRLKKCYRNSFVNNSFDKWEDPTPAQALEFYNLMRSRYDNRFINHSFSWFYGMDYKLDFALAIQRYADINNYIELSEERSPIYVPTSGDNIPYLICDKLPSLYQRGEFRCDIPYTPPTNRQGVMDLLGLGPKKILQSKSTRTPSPPPPPPPVGGWNKNLIF